MSPRYFLEHIGQRMSERCFILEKVHFCHTQAKLGTKAIDVRHYFEAGIWWVSPGCLEVVLNVHGGCLEFIWNVSYGCLKSAL